MVNCPLMTNSSHTRCTRSLGSASSASDCVTAMCVKFSATCKAQGTRHKRIHAPGMALLPAVRLWVQGAALGSLAICCVPASALTQATQMSSKVSRSRRCFSKPSRQRGAGRCVGEETPLLEEELETSLKPGEVRMPSVQTFLRGARTQGRVSTGRRRLARCSWPAPQAWVVPEGWATHWLGTRCADKL